jgi:hypothetical protein
MEKLCTNLVNTYNTNVLKPVTLKQTTWMITLCVFNTLCGHFNVPLVFDIQTTNLTILIYEDAL